jgi:hypothetical protein
MNTMLRLFDVPEPAAHSPARQLTTTPLQQLFVLNSPLMDRQSAALVERVFTELAEADTPTRIARCYDLLYSRAPRGEEIADAEQFLGRATRELGLAERDAWRHYVHALLGLNEMLFID